MTKRRGSKQHELAAVREALENDDGWRTSGELVMAWMSRWAEGYDEPMPQPDIFVKVQIKSNRPTQ
jgi:hypothetical protein